MSKSYYAIIPANVRYDKSLNSNAKLLYGEITALANEKGYCWASNGYFADLYDVSHRTIIRWINDLIDKKYIATEIIYKGNSKEVSERRLWIVAKLPSDKIDTTSCQSCHEPTDKSVMRGTDRNVTDNNTLLNNTLNNTDYLSSSSSISNNQSNTPMQSVEKEDDNSRLVFEFYQQNFGMLSPYIIQQLDYWIEDLNSEVVRLALEKALMNNARNFNYTNTVLNDWKSKNVKTVEDVRSLELEYNNKKPMKNQQKEKEKITYEFKTTRY